ncbi:MAG: RNA-binding protein [Acidobacteria bacterium]|nr:RNA-binding protein [Acidobacteriota bacterium]
MAAVRVRGFVCHLSWAFRRRRALLGDSGRKELIIAAKVFVGNVSFDTLAPDIEALFSSVGDIVEVFMPADRNTGRPRGFAFVEFADEDAAARAIEEFDGHELGGRNLRVNAAEARAPRASMPPSQYQRGGRNEYGKPSRPKGSRRNARGKKRSL